MSKATNQYIPGVCNIGPAEIAKRRQLGLRGAVLTIVLVAICVIFNLPTVIRLFVFFPAALGGTGFLQAYLHFCAGFGSKGLFNFGDDVGKTDSVDQAEYRAKDLKKARQILVGSAVIGIIVAIICILL